MPARDFFISFTAADQPWAQWIAVELEQAGYTTFFQARDILPGDNFIAKMHAGIRDCERVLAILSPQYLTNSRFGEDEWTAKWAEKPSAVIPIRIADCQPDGLLKPIVYIDLVGQPKPEARQLLLTGLRRVVPRISAIQPLRQILHLRNNNFTGREQDLQNLRASLETRGATAITALNGQPGIGKTSLATEYSYRYAIHYDLIWWVIAEDESKLSVGIADLAQKLLPAVDPANQPKLVAAALDWLTQHHNWLLVFDNAPNPDLCRPYCPHATTGHLIITSRNPNFETLGTPLPIEKLPRDEAIAFLLKRTKGSDQPAANDLCNTLGDLPLALEHAAAYITEKRKSLRQYLKLLDTHAQKLLEPVAKTFQLAFAAIENPEALNLLRLLAYFDPDNIPRNLFQPEIEADEQIDQLRRYSLIEAKPDSLSIHRLVQWIIRDHLTKPEQKQFAEQAVTLLANAFPEDVDNHETWPQCAKLLAQVSAATSLAEELTFASATGAHLLQRAGVYLFNQAQLMPAEGLLRRALEIAEDQYGPMHSEVAGCLNDLGIVLKYKGELEPAISLIQRALAIGEANLAPDHPDVVTRINNLATTLAEKGDLDAALPLAQRALALGEQTFGPEHPKIAQRSNNVAQILRLKGDIDAALPLTERAFAIDSKAYGPNHPKVALRANNLAQLLRAKGNLDDAIRLTRHALSIDEKVYGPNNPTIARDANNLALILQDKADLDGALPYAQRALAIWTTTLGPNHASTQIGLDNLRRLQAQIAARDAPRYNLHPSDGLEEDS